MLFVFDYLEVCDFFCDNVLYWIDEYCCDGLCLCEVDWIGVLWLCEIVDCVCVVVLVDWLIYFVFGSEWYFVYLVDIYFDV